MSTIDLWILTSVPNGPRKEEVVEQKESKSGQHSKELNVAPFPESSFVYPDPHWFGFPGSGSVLGLTNKPDLNHFKKGLCFYEDMFYDLGPIVLPYLLKYPYFHVINQLLVTAMPDQAPDLEPKKSGFALSWIRSALKTTRILITAKQKEKRF